MKESGQEYLKIICVDDSDNIIGYLPLLYTKGLPMGLGGILASKRLSSLPRTPVGGPISKDVKATKKIIDYVLAKISNQKDITLQIKSFSNEFNLIFPSLQSIKWREGYFKELPPLNKDIEFQNSKVKKELHRIIRRASENGIRVRSGSSLEDLRQWYKIYAQTMRYHATLTRSFEFFENLWNEFFPQKQLSLNLVEQYANNELEILAGTITFKYGYTTYGAFKGSRRDKLKYSINDILHYFELTQAQNEGYKIFDMGEVPRNHSGLEHYKKKWGMSNYSIYHYYYPKIDIVDDELDPGDADSIKKNLWRGIPLPVTTLIGKTFYKRL